jgi:nitrite reductase/ring-hydroxylating ferredoxin subunit
LFDPPVRDTVFAMELAEGVATISIGSALQARAALDIHLASFDGDAPFVQATPQSWIPAMRSAEAVARHIAFAQVQGVEIALWRDDDGHLNAWENRCPHRGVRLTIGTNTGTELVCRYHGWRFSTATATCAAIPAHPSQTPPPAARVAQYACVERDGFAWIHFGTPDDEPGIPGLDGRTATSVRSVVVDAPAERVRAALADEAQRPFVPERGARAHPLLVMVVAHDEATSVMHAVVAGEVAHDERATLLRDANERLKAIRRSVERV